MSDSMSGYQFLITQGAKEDLAFCRDKDTWAAARISALLREVVNHKVLAQWLIDPSYSSDVVLDIGEIASFRRVKIHAYRVKFVEIAGWRLIIAADHPGRRVALIAVMPRDDDYEKNTKLWKDIEREYDEHGFPRL